MGALWIWAGVLPIAGLGAWLALRRPIRNALEARGMVRARAVFRRQREALEARFLSALARRDPLEALRWDDACWLDEVLWARDRRTRRLLALVGVRFTAEEDAFGDADHTDDEPPRNATAVFEFRDGHWNAEGHHLDDLRPREACLRHRQFEPISLPPPRS
jgi:hypothetical protein